MTKRFQAPEHCSAVFTSTGEHRADERGIIALPDDAPASDHQELAAAGCLPIAEAPEAEPLEPEKPIAEAPAGGKSKR
jgi:hypothetical protein